MKITNKLIRRLVKESILKEMSFLGIPNIMRTQATGYNALSLTDVIKQQDPSIDPAVMGTDSYRDNVEKYFRSSRYSNEAVKLNYAFPESNVKIIPYIGSEASAIQTIQTGTEQGFEKLMSDPELMKLVPQVDSQGKYNYRTALYDMSTNQNMLVNIGVDPNTIDLQNDIIIVPVASVLKRGFIPSIHMTIHTMFDNDLFSYESNPSPDASIANIVEAMDILADFDFDDYQERIIRFKQTPVTKAIRNGKINTPFDFAAEVMTAFVFGYSALNNLDPSFYTQDIKNILLAARQEFRNYLKGNIVVVSVA